jgi:hypothetical protein
VSCFIAGHEAGVAGVHTGRAVTAAACLWLCLLQEPNNDTYKKALEMCKKVWGAGWARQCCCQTKQHAICRRGTAGNTSGRWHL